MWSCETYLSSRISLWSKLQFGHKVGEDYMTYTLNMKFLIIVHWKIYWVRAIIHKSLSLLSTQSMCVVLSFPKTELYVDKNKANQINDEANI